MTVLNNTIATVNSTIATFKAMVDASTIVIKDKSSQCISRLDFAYDAKGFDVVIGENGCLFVMEEQEIRFRSVPLRSIETNIYEHCGQNLSITIEAPYRLGVDRIYDGDRATYESVTYTTLTGVTETVVPLSPKAYLLDIHGKEHICNYNDISIQHTFTANYGHNYTAFYGTESEEIQEAIIRSEEYYRLEKKIEEIIDVLIEKKRQKNAYWVRLSYRSTFVKNLELAYGFEENDKIILDAQLEHLNFNGPIEDKDWTITTC